MKKGMFLPVIFILGFVAGVSGQCALYADVDGILDNASMLLPTTVIGEGIQHFKSVTFSADYNVLLGANTASGNNYNTLLVPKTTAQSGNCETSRVNSICKYKPKSLVKD